MSNREETFTHGTKLNKRIKKYPENQLCTSSLPTHAYYRIKHNIELQLKKESSPKETINRTNNSPKSLRRGFHLHRVEKLFRTDFENARSWRETDTVYFVPLSTIDYQIPTALLTDPRCCPLHKRLGYYLFDLFNTVAGIRHKRNVETILLRPSSHLDFGYQGVSSLSGTYILAGGPRFSMEAIDFIRGTKVDLPRTHLAHGVFVPLAFKAPSGTNETNDDSLLSTLVRSVSARSIWFDLSFVSVS